MITLTGINGLARRIDGARVQRLRRALLSEDKTKTAKSRVDWVNFDLVREEVSAIAPLIRAEVPSFTNLHARKGAEIWFNALNVEGPVAISAWESQGIFRSALMIMDQKHFVTETHAEVATVISNAGGTPLPIPADPMWLAVLSYFRGPR